MNKPNHVYLKHILDAIHRIEKYTLKINHAEFLKNQLVQDGVIRQLEVIGEATKHTSDELKKKHTNIPWKDIAGMRDKLIHAYFGVDLDAVWDTVKKDVPPLKSKIMKIL